MFHGEGEVFGEGVEESEVGFCLVFISEGSTSVIKIILLRLFSMKIANDKLTIMNNSFKQ